MVPVRVESQIDKIHRWIAKLEIIFIITILIEVNIKSLTRIKCSLPR